MKDVHVPSKESVREWIDRRIREDEPPPSIQEIRLQLGWHLQEPERRKHLDDLDG